MPIVDVTVAVVIDSIITLIVFGFVEPGFPRININSGSNVRMCIINSGIDTPTTTCGSGWSKKPLAQSSKIPILSRSH